MDVLTPAQRHKNMQNIRSKDTSIELILRKELRKQHISYRIHFKELPGKPDIVLTKYKIAIFCDSEFFHGKDWEEDLLPRLKKSNNSEFWINKIQSNILRDETVNRQLKGMGWQVLRFWGKEIKSDPLLCVKAIKEVIAEKQLENISL